MKKYIIVYLLLGKILTAQTLPEKDCVSIDNAEFSYVEDGPLIELSRYRISKDCVSYGEFIEIINWGIEQYQSGLPGIDIEYTAEETKIFYKNDMEDIVHSVLEIENEFLESSGLSLTDGGKLAAVASEEKAIDRLPWLGTVIYCHLKSSHDGLESCYSLDTLGCDFSKEGYRLPTEAELYYFRKNFQESNFLYEYCWDLYRYDNSRIKTSGRDPYGAKSSPWVVALGKDDRKNVQKEKVPFFNRFRTVQSVQDPERLTDIVESPRYRIHRLILTPSLGFSPNGAESFKMSLSYLFSPVSFFSFGAGFYTAVDWITDNPIDSIAYDVGLKAYPFIIGDCSKFAVGASFSINPFWDFFVPNHDFCISLDIFIKNFLLELGFGQNESSFTYGAWLSDNELVIERSFIFYLGLGYSLGF